MVIVCTSHVSITPFGVVFSLKKCRNVSVKIFCWNDDNDRWKINSSCSDRTADKEGAFQVEPTNLTHLLY